MHLAFVHALLPMPFLLLFMNLPVLYYHLQYYIIYMTCSSLLSVYSFCLLTLLCQESKLNPHAKVFAPSFASSRPVLAAASPVNPNYISNSVSGVPTGVPVFQTHLHPGSSSLSSKVVHYNNLAPGNFGMSPQYVQSVSNLISFSWMHYHIIYQVIRAKYDIRCQLLHMVNYDMFMLLNFDARCCLHFLHDRLWGIMSEG